MREFDVLSRSLNVHQSYLLEASAGTGKTFSIENIVLRLLLEPILGTDEVYDLEQLLIVTFTRAATRDLKRRIRTCIDKAKQFFIGVREGEKNPCPADYLNAYIDADESVIRKCIQLLERALFSFDKAQITTIHGFCSRMLKENVLEGGLALDINLEMTENSGSCHVRSIRDFFRTQSLEGTVSLSQLLKLKHFHTLNQAATLSESIEKKLLKTIQQGLPIVKPKRFNELYDEFCSSMKKLKNEYGFTANGVVNDIALISKNYKAVGTYLEELPLFANLFDLNEWSTDHFNTLIQTNSLPWNVLKETKVKCKPIPQESLHYCDILEILKNELKPTLDSASNPEMIYAGVAYECKNHVTNYLREEEIYSFNDLLTLMKESLQQEGMKTAIRNLYKVAVIDEFQDTDPVQWEIFRQLFLDDTRIIYLVGDPKQSIYAFRQADIYTYLEARKELGEDRHASLDTNYRSTPELIQSLNILFEAKNAPGLISLPGINEDLPYRPVLPSKSTKEKIFHDGLGAVHFCLATTEKTYNPENAETDFFLPFIRQKIMEHRHHDQIPYKGFAILISDRYQSARVADYLRKHNISCMTQKTTNISDSPAIESLRELLKAVIHTNSSSAVKVALGGRILSWTHRQISSFDDPDVAESILYKFRTLRSDLYFRGISLFFQSLMKCQPCDDGVSVAEKILSKTNGSEFFTDLEHVVDLLSDYEQETKASPDRLLLYLDEIKNENIGSPEKLSRRSDPTQDAVHILTGHTSKGLEFDVVFPLSLLKRPKEPELFFPHHDEEIGHALLAVSSREDPRYLRYCDEIDAEKMRQLYVCMTRAKYRLYVPVIEPGKKNTPERGCASPLDLYLARLAEPLVDTCGLYERIKEYSHDRLISFIEKHPSNLTYTHLKEHLEEGILDMPDEKVIMKAPIQPEIRVNKKFMYSFSSITGKKQEREEKEKRDIPPKDYVNPVKNCHTLPACSDTGNLLHKILETLSFSDIGMINSFEEFVPIIEHFTEKSPYQGWEEAIASIIWKTIKTPIIGTTPLSAINLLYKEMEFIFPYREDYDIEELKVSEGYLKGVIDLTFYHDGKYYLLDWKSNWLGPSNEFYTKEQIIKSMHEHEYFLQAAIYKEALKRYLKAVDSRDFDDIYGGTYYVFLRGIENEGVFYFE